MLSGYINTAQDVVDIINSCLINKEGILDFFSNGSFISLYVEKGYVKAFSTANIPSSNVRNKIALLFYHMSEVLENPEGFFTFREDKLNENFLVLEQPIQAEELVLQLQLISTELRSLIEKVITPFAVLKAQKPFEGMERYNEKSLYEIISSSEESILDTLRKVKELLLQGFLDIHQFYNIGEEKEEKLYAEYIIKDVEAKKINLSSILENLRLSKFTGFLKTQDFELYYVKGKPISLYPINYDVFEFFLNPNSSVQVNVVSMDAVSMNLYMLRHSEKRSISNLHSDFIEVGKVFMGISKSKSSGLITLYTPQRNFHLLYEEGNLRGILQEEQGHIKVVSQLKLEKPFWVDVVFYEPMGNMSTIVYLFLINLVYGILLKHVSDVAQSVMGYIASSDIFLYEEGSIRYRKNPKEEDDAILSFLSTLLDIGYRTLGQKKLEEALESALQPYRDVFKIMDVEEFIKFPDESASR
ncbi:hypothetical protein [Hydrogenobacter hydrogenophilus]|uniref:Uncharacterized protein n=1 Tax=Hydrogenobacter hydrogenophilus TaxID=35835 RepID=A0A285NU84_9AQUI|nr:hypothetical protein [Hydrogenobacter hydrogenophilus]SNZ13052.1 hypothetical protein SAMN06265353_0602 [Hydrogenobacter hydrogenophilus]